MGKLVEKRMRIKGLLVALVEGLSMAQLLYRPKELPTSLRMFEVHATVVALGTWDHGM